MTQIILPDTPSSVMELFNADKVSLNRFIESVIISVNNGAEDPLKVHTLIKKQEYVLDNIKARIKEQVKTEAAKYGDKPFLFAGAEVHLTTVKSEYDYSVCGDPTYEKLVEQLDELKAKIKQREEMLKTLGNPIQLLDEETGEVNTICPPMKRSETGVKVSLK